MVMYQEGQGVAGEMPGFSLTLKTYCLDSANLHPGSDNGTMAVTSRAHTHTHLKNKTFTDRQFLPGRRRVTFSV